MPLREEFVTSGNWLFRWRSYLPLVLLIPVVIVMTSYQMPSGGLWADRLWEALCFFVSFLGIVVRVAAVGCAPAGTSGRNTGDGQIASVLNTSGLYSIVRHPLYVGNFLIWIGVASLPHSATLVLFVALAFWLYYERIMFAEEEFLRAKFGDVYVSWAASTPAFIPRLTGWHPPSLTFSARSALRREASGLLGVVSCFTLLDAVGESSARGTLYIDPAWVVIFFSTLALYVVLLTLKRRTHVLSVEGR